MTKSASSCRCGGADLGKPLGSVCHSCVKTDFFDSVQVQKRCATIVQVSVLTDQVEVQGEKIRDLETCLEHHQQKLSATEELLQQVTLQRIVCIFVSRFNLSPLRLTLKHSLIKRACAGAAERQRSGDPEAGADDRGVHPEAEADGRRQRSAGRRGELQLLWGHVAGSVFRGRKGRSQPAGALQHVLGSLNPSHAPAAASCQARTPPNTHK